jgi:hypothetical protein
MHMMQRPSQKSGWSTKLDELYRIVAHTIDRARLTKEEKN